jgi:DNA polymerase I-like protein with 3'-5' exonuclease and polymerase domains/uracil-DNA glycosylase
MPEDNPGARFAVVSDCASDHEQREGRPVVGPAGTLFTQMMSSAGAKRKDVHWNMVALCRPPDNDMGRLVERIRKDNQKVTKENAERKKNGLDELPLQLTPAECCAPRLWRDLSKFENFIAVGGMATRTLVHATASVMNIRGAPTEVDKFGRTLKVMPVLHPSFVLRAQRWRHVLQNDLNRAVRWFRGAMKWKPPEILYHPDAYTLRKFLSDPNVPYWTYDVETDGIEALTANLRCIGIGTPEKVVIVGYAPIKAGDPPFYTDAEQHAVTQVLREFFADTTKLKAGHNAGVYDKLVIENQLGVTPKPILDTILLHRLVESELPHNLGFVGSMYTDAPSWKTDREGRKLAYGSETDHELHEYCAYDVAVTAAVVPQLFEQTRLREQDHLVKSDHAIQVVCAEMHKAGMYVDQEVRGEWETKLVGMVEKHRTALRDISGMDKLNPGSTFQLRDLLFEKWRLEPPVEDEVRFTTSGDPSTSDEVLRACLTIKGLNDTQRGAIQHIRYFRKAQKLLGTYVVKLRYNTDLAELGWDDEDEQSEKESRQIYGDQKKGIVDPRTGRMHPGYNAHVAVTGRLSSSKPINAQNFPAKLRNMVKAAPGNVLVGADADQLELRIAASRWESRLYLDALEAGADPHASTALTVFEGRFKESEGYPGGHWDGRLFIPNGEGKWGGAAKNLRNIAKGVQYSSQYWAEVETVHRVIAQTEVDNGDGTTTLPYLNITLREVRMMHQKWLEGAKFAAGWDREMETYRNTGFIAEPVMGRRRDFLDGESRNEVVNFPIQASGASLMNIALLQVAEQIPLHKWGPGTGIINQCHDAIVVECPADGCEFDPETKKWKVPKGSIPWQVKHIIEEAMNLRHKGLPNVKFTATAEIGLRWNEV